MITTMRLFTFFATFLIFPGIATSFAPRQLASVTHTRSPLSFGPPCSALTSLPRLSVSGSSTKSATVIKAMALDGASAAIDTFFQTQPYVSAFLTCSFKASAADFVAQTQQQQSIDDNSEIAAVLEHKEEKITNAASKDTDDESSSLDVSRNMAFLFYGGLYQGMFQELMYNVLFPAWFGTEQTWKTIATTVAVDNSIMAPLLCLPVAYMVKAAFTSVDEDGSSPLEIMRDSLGRYYEDVTERGLLFKYWSLWIPVQTLTFSVIPPHFRIAFVAFVSFFWVFILSSVSSATAAETAQSNDAVTG